MIGYWRQFFFFIPDWRRQREFSRDTQRLTNILVSSFRSFRDLDFLTLFKRRYIFFVLHLCRPVYANKINEGPQTAWCSWTSSRNDADKTQCVLKFKANSMFMCLHFDYFASSQTFLLCLCMSPNTRLHMLTRNVVALVFFFISLLFFVVFSFRQPRS